MSDDRISQPEADVATADSSDRELISRAQDKWKAGDSDNAYDLFVLFLDRILPQLVHAALREGLNTDDAEDIAMETAHGFRKYFESGEAILNPRSLMMNILERRIIDFRRKRSGRKKTDPKGENIVLGSRELLESDGDGNDWDNIVDGSRPLHEEVDEKLFQATLNLVLNALTKEDRDVLLTRHVKRLSVEESAKSLGLSVDQVKSRTVRALKRAREVMIEQRHVEGGD